MRITGTAVKLTVFVTVSVLAAVLVVNTLNRPLESSSRTYHAEFTDAEGLTSGSEVRMAGVRVGKIDDVELADGRALVTLEVLDQHRIPGDSRALVRYADLLGGRYVALEPGGGAELADGDTIPLARTQPALELTSLLNGFKPLFDTIDPGTANDLANELVATFQGEEGTITSLLEHVVSITTRLTDRDAVLGQLLSNLNAVIGTASDHRGQLHALVDRLGGLTSQMAQDREQIGHALDSGSSLARSLSGSTNRILPQISHDMDVLRPLAGSLARDQDKLDATVQGAPELLTRINRTADQGSWLNIYACNLKLSVAGQEVDLSGGPHSKVCR